MRRRDCLALAFSPLLGAATGPRTTISARSMRLDLVNTWTTVMSSSTYRETLGVSVVSGGITGVGEGAPIVRYNESAAQGIEIVNGLREVFAGADPSQYVKLLAKFYGEDMLDPTTYQAITRSSALVLCPFGNNPETHRFYEALSVGSIPISRM